MRRARWKGAINCSTHSLAIFHAAWLGRAIRFVPGCSQFRARAALKLKLKSNQRHRSSADGWFIWNATTLCVHHSGFSFVNKRVSLSLLSVLVYAQETHRADGSVEELQTPYYVFWAIMKLVSYPNICALERFQAESAQYLILNNYLTQYFRRYFNEMSRVGGDYLKLLGFETYIFRFSWNWKKLPLTAFIIN